jgi:uncharacterized protein (TIGR02284 family)
MHAEDNKPLEVLNALIGINNNRIECFRFLTKATDMSLLKGLFRQFISTSTACREELIHEVYKLGGKPHEGTLATKEFFRVWQELYSAASEKDHRAVLYSSCCEEHLVSGMYSKMLAVDDEHITTLQRQLIQKQFVVLSSECGKIHNLREAIAA